MTEQNRFDILKIIIMWAIVLVFFLAFMIVFNRYSPEWIERIEFRDPYLHLQEGRKYLEEGELQQARQKFQYAIEFDDQLGWAYFYLGDIHDRSGEEEQAMRYYYQALEVEPDVPNFSYRLGHKYFQKQDYETAIMYFERVLELDPSESLLANSLHYLARLRIKMNNYIAGFYYYEMYLEQYPADFHSVLTLADLYYEHGLFEKALEHYQNYLKHVPDNDEVQEKIARTQERIRTQQEQEEAEIPEVEEEEELS